DGLRDRDARLRRLLLVDLLQQPGERLLGLVVGLDRLPGVLRYPGQGVGSNEGDGAPGIAGELLDVPTLAALPGRHSSRIGAFIPRTRTFGGGSSKTAGQIECPRQDSNLRSRLRRPVDPEISRRLEGSTRAYWFPCVSLETYRVL